MLSPTREFCACRDDKKHLNRQSLREQVETSVYAMNSWDIKQQGFYLTSGGISMGDEYQDEYQGWVEPLCVPTTLKKGLFMCGSEFIRILAAVTLHVVVF